MAPISHARLLSMLDIAILACYVTGAKGSAPLRPGTITSDDEGNVHIETPPNGTLWVNGIDIMGKLSSIERMITEVSIPPSSESPTKDWVAAAAMMQKVKASDEDTADFFGYAVAVDSGFAAISAKQHDGAETKAGAVYVFKLDQSSNLWLEEATLFASDADRFDYMGESVSISGARILVGAHGHGSGAAYVFERTEEPAPQWSQQAKLTPSDGGGNFGYSVALSGDIAVVGSFENNNDMGAAYVFEASSNGQPWSEVAKLSGIGLAQGDEFGRAVAVSSDTIVVAGYKHGGNGAVWVFERNTVSGLWQERAKLVASDGADRDRFGSSVAISGAVIVVGAFFDDDVGTSSGSAYVFERLADGVWTQQAKLLAADGESTDYFGGSVAVSGHTILVGASGHRDAGAAYLFQKSNGWGQTAKLVSTDTDQTGDKFGDSVAISSTAAVIGASLDSDGDLQAGAAFVF